jgi:tRNA-Thr(GGU) m(6)t(6)A37 methyltransferase TsaA
MSWTFSSIGTIRSPFREVKGMPIQPAGARHVQGHVIVEQVYEEGLADIEGFSHIILIYVFHQSKEFSLSVKPFMDTKARGLFSTRAPRRPNPIGLSVVRLLKREENILHIQGVDVLDRTPLLDIKPYAPAFDSVPNALVGWMTGKETKVGSTKADDRFK